MINKGRRSVITNEETRRKRDDDDDSRHDGVRAASSIVVVRAASSIVVVRQRAVVRQHEKVRTLVRGRPLGRPTAQDAHAALRPSSGVVVAATRPVRPRVRREATRGPAAAAAAAASPRRGRARPDRVERRDGPLGDGRVARTPRAAAAAPGRLVPARSHAHCGHRVRHGVRVDPRGAGAVRRRHGDISRESPEKKNHEKSERNPREPRMDRAESFAGHEAAYGDTDRE